MIETIISLAIVTLLSSAFSVFINKKLTPKWDSRENYGYIGEQWKKPLIIAAVVAVIFTSILGFFIGTSMFISAALGLLGYFLTITALTDAKSHLIPKELTNLALIVGSLTGILGFLTDQYYSSDYIISKTSQLTMQLTNFGLYMFVISLLFVVIMFSPVIGFGDIKMFWATGLFIGSFFVFTELLAVFMVMFVVMAVQLGVSMVKAKSWKMADGLPALPAFAVAFISVTLVTNLLGVTS